MTLKSEIERWDTKSKDAIAAVYDRHSGEPEFVHRMIDLIADEATQTGATWLLKHYFDEGGAPLDEQSAATLTATLDRLTHWEAKLHILQSLDHIPIPYAQVETAETFIRDCLSANEKFVRAWAYSAFHELAKQHPRYRPQVTRLLAHALETETAASVRARVRRKVQEGF